MMVFPNTTTYILEYLMSFLHRKMCLVVFLVCIEKPQAIASAENESFAQ
jgi:hypothetical protein